MVSGHAQNKKRGFTIKKTAKPRKTYLKSKSQKESPREVRTRLRRSFHSVPRFVLLGNHLLGTGLGTQLDKFVGSSHHAQPPVLQLVGSLGKGGRSILQLLSYRLEMADKIGHAVEQHPSRIVDGLLVLSLLHLGPGYLDNAECRRKILLTGDEHPFGECLTPQLRCFCQRQLERPFVGYEHDDVIQSLTRQLDVRTVILAGQFGHMLPYAPDMPL